MKPEIIPEAHNTEAEKAITARSDAVFLCYRDGMHFTQYHEFLLKAECEQLNVPYKGIAQK